MSTKTLSVSFVCVYHILYVFRCHKKTKQKKNLKINLRFLKKRPGKIIKACNSQIQLLHFLILEQNKIITPQGIRGSRDAMGGLSMLCRLAATMAKAFQVHGQDVHSNKPGFQWTNSKYLSHFLFMYHFFFPGNRKPMQMWKVGCFQVYSK